MEARNRPLPDWFTRLRSRQLVLPRFQRFEAWNHGQINALLDTVLRGLPSGALLTLEVGDKEPFVSRPIAGAAANGERVIEHLLDGQQRLTALWRSLNDTYEARTYLIKLGPDEETGQPYFAISQARWQRQGRKYPLWIDQPEKLWERRLLPASLLNPVQEAEALVKDWAKSAAGNDPDSMIEIIQLVNRLRSIFSSYNIPFLSLPNSTDRETALNVFIRMNTSATPLSDYDIVVAQVEASTELSMHDLVDLLSDKAPNIHVYASKPADLMLSVSALLQSKTPTKSTFLAPEFSEKMIEDWERTEFGIQRMLKFLDEEGIPDGKRLPTDVVLSPLAALWAITPIGLDAEGTARILLRRYMWRSFFTERYDRTSATRALADFKELSALLNGESDKTPMVLDEEQYPLPDVDALMFAGWPLRKDRAARGLLAISLKAGGHDFADGRPTSRDSLKEREYHHLFPRAWLLAKGYSEALADTAVNCALVTWKTNRALASKSPSEYIKDRMASSNIDEAVIKSRLETHLIPYEELVSDSLEIFRKRRAELLHQKMVKLCNGELV